jgi:MerR family transcriptional regulator, light-induced transcriptional regulator
MPANQEPDVLAQALAEPTRRAILENLRFGQKTVTELVRATGRKQPNLSNHLAKMRHQGLVGAERIGRQVYYSLATPFADVRLRFYETIVSALAVEGSGFDLAHAANQPPAVVSEEKVISLTAWRDAYVQSLSTRQEDRVVAVVNAMLAQHLPLETIYGEVFQPALYRIGQLIVQGEINEAQEPLASALTERMMAKVALFYAPIVRVPYRAVLGCVAGNWHALGLRMLSDGLRVEGWNTLFLGANVPTSSFLTMVTTAHPDLVVISCSLAEHVPATHELLAHLTTLRENDLNPPFQIAVGGDALHTHPELLAEFPVDFTAPDLHHFLTEVRTRFAPSS